MTVGELIEELKKQPDYLDVKITVAGVYSSDFRVTDDNWEGVHFIILIDNR